MHNASITFIMSIEKLVALIASVELKQCKIGKIAFIAVSVNKHEFQMKNIL